MNNIDKVTLPSNGLLGIEHDIEVRGMKGIELSTLYSSFTDASIEAIIRAVTNPSLDPNGLCDEDKAMILHSTRRLTFGDEIELTLRCPMCGKVDIHTVNYKDFEVGYLDADKLKEVIVMSDNKVITKAIPTNKVWNAITRHKEKRNLPDTYAFILLQISKIGTVDGKKLSIAELVDYLENLPAKELLKLSKKLEINFGMNKSVKVACKSCKTEFMGGIGINADLFR